LGYKMAEKTRREFVKTAAQVAVAAPTVAILLNGPAKATIDPGGNPYRGSAPGTGDDAGNLTGGDDFNADGDGVFNPGDDTIP